MKSNVISLTTRGDVSMIIEPAAWIALFLAITAVLLLASLHILSPEFDPSWRVISEYAFGRYPWVLSLMFLAMGSSSWALAVAIWRQVQTRGGKTGLWFLMVAGLGGNLASVFDISHAIEHTISGLLGVVGFPIAALLLSASLGRNETWRVAKKTLLTIANLNWISDILLVLTLTIMSVQMARLNGGHLPQHAPKALPPGVLALDGWADRLIVLSSSAWVFWAALIAIRVHQHVETRS